MTALLLLSGGSILLHSPPGIEQVNRRLSRILGQPVTVNSFKLTSRGLYLQGVTIVNVPPFTGNLLTIRSLRLVPALRLVNGRPALALLEVSGPALNLEKQRSGSWNTAPLLQRLRERSGDGETFIKFIRLKEVSVRINSRPLPVFDFSLAGLATRGSHTASWRLSCSDHQRNTVDITGTFRPGSSPALTLAVNHQCVSLHDISRFIEIPRQLDPTRGTAALSLTASLQGAGLNVSGDIAVSGLALRIRQKMIPLSGTFRLDADSRRENDAVRITRGKISLHGIAVCSGTAHVSGLTRERKFAAELSGGIDLGAGQRLLSPDEAKKVPVTGTLTVRKLALTGNSRQGLTGCKGPVTLENVSATWKGHALAKNILATFFIEKRPPGWSLTGHVSSSADAGSAELRSFTGGISARMTPAFAPIRIAVSPFSAIIRGIPLSGEAAYDASAATPFILHLAADAVQLPTIPLPERLGRITTGTASIKLTASSNLKGDRIHGEMSARVENFAAESPSGHTLSDTEAMMRSRFQGGAALSKEATGNISTAGVFDGTKISAVTGFTVTPDLLLLEQGQIGRNDLQASFTRLSGMLPRYPLENPQTFPVRLQVDGAGLMWRDLALRKFSGTLDGIWQSSGKTRLTYTLKGTNLSATSKGNNLFSGIEVTAGGEYDTDRITLQQGRITVGPALTVDVSGSIDRLTAATRSGTFTVRMPETAAGDAVKACIGILPGQLREIRTEGVIAVDGTLAVEKGGTTADGRLHIRGGGFSLPSRQFSVGGIEGSVPLSFVIPPGEATPQRSTGFSRENYQQNRTFLEQIRGVPTLRFSHIRFGALETGEARFILAASGGLTRLERFETSMYGGTASGRGAFSWNRHLTYDAELLVHDVSLSRFCSTIPAISGYLSGRVDGVAGMHGDGGSAKDMKGFFSLWARPASDEEMLVSREFLQKLAGKKLRGFFLRDDRSYDRAELSGHLSGGFLTFSELDISHTNMFGIRDLEVGVAPTHNRIELQHFITAVKTAMQRGKPARDEGEPMPADLPQTEFRWLE